MKTLTCRAHGGTFQVEPKRGRPPVRCTDDNQCSMPTAMPGQELQAHNKRVARQATPATNVAKAADRAEQMPRKVAVRVVEFANPSVAPAQVAKEKLEAQGWTVKGSAKGLEATLTASRDEELLIMEWQAGAIVTQDYSLWNMEQPTENNKPEQADLPFDLEESSDREIIRALSGMKVTWWNKLGSFEMTAVVDTEKIQIEHCYNGLGNETPADRIVKFVDRNNGGFRAFRLGALLKVG